MVSCITASFELSAIERPDLTYLSQSFLLTRANAELRYPTQIYDPKKRRFVSKELIPDALFGLEYETAQGKRYRCFAVEADRSTEPATSDNFNRKSVLRNYQQYQDYVLADKYRCHLRLKAPLLVLNVATDAKRVSQMIGVLSKVEPALSEVMLFQSWDDFGPLFKPPEPNDRLLSERWKRANKVPLKIGEI